MELQETIHLLIHSLVLSAMLIEYSQRVRNYAREKVNKTWPLLLKSSHPVSSTPLHEQEIREHSKCYKGVIIPEFHDSNRQRSSSPHLRTWRKTP
jgi:hypothetical protein